MKLTSVLRLVFFFFKYGRIYNFPREAFDIHTQETEEEKEMEDYEAGVVERESRGEINEAIHKKITSMMDKEIDKVSAERIGEAMRHHWRMDSREEGRLLSASTP